MSVSAPFYKILAGVFAGHMIALSLIWIGFSAPLPRPPAAFVYQGALSVEDTGGQPSEARNELPAAEIVVGRLSNGDLNHWTGLRKPSKPFDYADLGL